MADASFWTASSWLRAASVFLGKHDRHHSTRDFLISRVRRCEAKVLVVIIDLEKDAPSFDFDGTKIVLAIRIVGRESSR